MGSSEIRILIKDPDYPCKPYRNPHKQFWVDIMHCNGDFLEWEGITYNRYPLKNKIHAQIKAPPGCYLVRAVGTCSNVSTQTAVIQVCCDQIVCVNLLVTNPRFCFTMARLALHPILLPNVPRDRILNAVEAIEGVIEYLPRDRLAEIPDNLLDVLLKKEKKLQRRTVKQTSD